MITPAEYRAAIAADLDEATLQTRVERIARELGYLTYHTHDSRRSQPGFPDLVLVHRRTGRLVIRELKTARGRTTTAQDEWLTALTAGGHDAGIWRPSDLYDEAILRHLHNPAPRP